MEFSEKVLVLQVGKFKEADLWVRLLSPTRGLISAFAFGGSRSRRRFVGCLDVFNEVHVRISASSRTSYLALQEGVLIRGVTRLRGDWQRFGLAVNCVRFLQSFGVGPEGAGEAVFLVREILRLLEEQESIPRLLPMFFRVRLAFDQGYALGMTRCSRCGRELSAEEDAAYLILREGCVVCSSCCGHRAEQLLPLRPETLGALRDIRSIAPSQWAGIPLSPLAAREFARAVDGFIQYHVGIAWDRGRFVRH